MKLDIEKTLRVKHVCNDLDTQTVIKSHVVWVLNLFV